MSPEIVADTRGVHGLEEQTLLEAEYEEILSKPGDSRGEEWENQAVQAFERRMLDKESPFPCVFGVDAVRNGTLRYCFVSEPAGSDTLFRAVQQFAEQCHDLGKRTSLVAFFEGDPLLKDIDDCQLRFWNVLRELIVSDDQPWPSGISTDTESSFWEFSCFGVPFFVVANTPHHRHRRSRYFDYFTITFQPRFVFDELGTGTSTGDNARKIIRGRLKEYDSLAPYPALGNFGDTTNREWVQYFIPDDNVTPSSSRKCPLHDFSPAKESTMNSSSPEFLPVANVELSPGLLELLPQQGSVELQHDQAGKVFAWHKHSLSEELFILSGDVTLFWIDAEGVYGERYCNQGTHIKLPAGTVHGSTAGRQGARYVIKPEEGRTAVTTFLREEEWPYPPVAPVSLA